MQKLLQNIAKVVRGKDEQLEKLCCALLAGGHVLLEDVPGTGKTVLARALAKSLDLTFSRLQCTPDLLPSDITGVSIFHPQKQEFEFKPGPVFTQLLLADEINRATPRTQSALLEAMAEQQVSVDGNSYDLDPAFFLMATQNPIEYSGTFPLPEAQLDRFMMRLQLGYPDAEHEVEILQAQQEVHPLSELQNCMSKSEFESHAQATAKTKIHPVLLHYIQQICQATREHPEVVVALSTRAAAQLMQASKALAYIRSSAFVCPEHIQELATEVLAHRLVLNSQMSMQASGQKNILEAILAELPLPIGYESSDS